MCLNRIDEAYKHPWSPSLRFTILVISHLRFNNKNISPSAIDLAVHLTAELVERRPHSQPIKPGRYSSCLRAYTSGSGEAANITQLRNETRQFQSFRRRPIYPFDNPMLFTISSLKLI